MYQIMNTGLMLQITDEVELVGLFRKSEKVRF